MASKLDIPISILASEVTSPLGSCLHSHRSLALEIWVFWAVLLSGLVPSPGIAGMCSVPGTHTTLQVAIDDGQCSSIELTESSYFASATVQRGVEIFGSAPNGTRILGTLEILTGGEVDLSDLTVDSGGATTAILATAGGRISTTNVLAVRVGQLFLDGFESGTTSAWSSAAPRSVPEPSLPNADPPTKLSVGPEADLAGLPSNPTAVKNPFKTRRTP